MPAIVHSFLRCLLALSLWVGVGLATSSAEPAAPGVLDLRGDLHLRLVELLGGPERCGDEDGAEAEILCGGDLVADLLVDPSVLKLSRGSCSRLLEALFRQTVCDPNDDDCGKLRDGGLPPGVPPDLLGPAGSLVLLASRDVDGSYLVVRRAAHARDGPPPASRDARPPAPPPRARLA